MTAVTKKKDWRQMSPATARALSWIIFVIVASAIWRAFWPTSWTPIGALLTSLSPLGIAAIIGFFATVVIETYLMEWFGKRDESGKINDFIDPTAKRLDEIEAAINRLHEYVQEIDPDLDEERRLWDDFMNEKHMLAGADHFQYVRDREAAGKRTLRGFRHSIWRDPAKVSGQQQTGE